MHSTDIITRNFDIIRLFISSTCLLLQTRTEKNSRFHSINFNTSPNAIAIRFRGDSHSGDENPPPVWLTITQTLLYGIGIIYYIPHIRSVRQTVNFYAHKLTSRKAVTHWQTRPGILVLYRIGGALFANLRNFYRARTNSPSLSGVQ